MNTEDLRRLLAHQTPATNRAGLLRVEIRQGYRRRNRIVWASWDEAARLLTRHGDQAAILAIDTSARGTDPGEGLP